MTEVAAAAELYCVAPPIFEVLLEEANNLSVSYGLVLDNGYVGAGCFTVEDK